MRFSTSLAAMVVCMLVLAPFSNPEATDSENKLMFEPVMKTDASNLSGCCLLYTSDAADD